MFDLNEWRRKNIFFVCFIIASSDFWRRRKFASAPPSRNHRLDHQQHQQQSDHLRENISLKGKEGGKWNWRKRENRDKGGKLNNYCNDVYVLGFLPSMTSLLHMQKNKLHAPSFFSINKSFKYFLNKIFVQCFKKVSYCLKTSISSLIPALPFIPHPFFPFPFLNTISLFIYALQHLKQLTYQIISF